MPKPTAVKRTTIELELGDMIDVRQADNVTIELQDQGYRAQVLYVHVDGITRLRVKILEGTVLDSNVKKTQGE